MHWRPPSQSCQSEFQHHLPQSSSFPLIKDGQPHSNPPPPSSLGNYREEMTTCDFCKVRPSETTSELSMASRITAINICSRTMNRRFSHMIRGQSTKRLLAIIDQQLFIRFGKEGENGDIHKVRQTETGAEERLVKARVC